MTQYIEEARKLEPRGWLVKPKGSAKVGTFFDHEPHFTGCKNWSREDYEVNPVYDAAALAAAEERGRIEERERCATNMVGAALTAEQLCKTPLIEWLVPTTEEWNACEVMQDRYNLMKRRVQMAFTDAAITKEPTP